VIGPPAWADGPVDPGEHTLEVKAPGYAPYATTFIVRAAQKRLSVSIPALAPVAAPPPLVPGASQHPGTSPVRIAGFAVGGTGAAALIVAAVLGGDALAKANAVHNACETTCGSLSVLSENQTAGTLADSSTGLFIAGGTLVAAGALMVLFAPHAAEPSSPAPIGVQLGPGYLGVTGSF
jgi:hypothetical protein